MNNITEMTDGILRNRPFDEYNRQSCLEGKPLGLLQQKIDQCSAGEANPTELISTMIISFNLYANSFPKSLSQAVHQHLNGPEEIPVAVSVKKKHINAYLDSEKNSLILPIKIAQEVRAYLSDIPQKELINTATKLTKVLHTVIDKNTRPEDI